MIIKNFELNNINIDKNKFFLFYGENQGLKKELIQKYFKIKFKESFYNYDEKDILENEEKFFDDIFSKSFFENKKLIIISRATDKIKSTIEEVILKKISDIVIILNSGTLEKKSKLRNFFEKNKDIICIPFYPDDKRTLSNLANNYFKQKKISISQEASNIIVERCRGDRQNLNNELEKLENFLRGKSGVDIKDILRLTNLAENYDVSELVDNCLAKNKKRTVGILNENNFTLEDCIIIVRTFLMKSKRLLKLLSELDNRKNIDSVITAYKPPIFWKDKEMVKWQLKSWSLTSAKNLLFQINEVELLIKKNSSSSINILSNFIIEQTISVSN
tara:strand:- start:596 stop:1591 length:996 start_codon:yes stop_codon:yes gene_type:complete